MYVMGFVVAVPEANKAAYKEQAARAAAMFRENGATRVTENWGDNVPDGVTTDFRRAVKAEPGEIVVFSWVEFPSRAAADAADKAMQAGMPAGMEMPFDGKRMIWGGFETILDA